MRGVSNRKNGLTGATILWHRLHSSRFCTTTIETNFERQFAFSKRSKPRKKLGTQAYSHLLAHLPQNLSELTPSTYLNDCGSFENIHKVKILNMRAGQEEFNRGDVRGFDKTRVIVPSINSHDGVLVEVNNVMHINSSIIPIESNEVDFYGQYIYRNEPCIIINLTDEWPATKTKKWSIEILLKTYRSTHFLYNYWFEKLGVDISTERSEDAEFTMKIDNEQYAAKIGNDIKEKIVSVDDEDQQNQQNIMTLQSFLDKHVIWERSHRKSNDYKGIVSQVRSSEIVSYLFRKYSANLPYIFDSAFDQKKGKNLLLDYNVPSIFDRKNEILRSISTFTDINFRWFLLGPRFSGTVQEEIACKNSNILKKHSNSPLPLGVYEKKLLFEFFSIC